MVRFVRGPLILAGCLFASILFGLQFSFATPGNEAPAIPEATALINGDFEAGALGWSGTTSAITSTLPAPVAARSGTFAVSLQDGNLPLSISQQFTVPVDMPYLTYWVWTESTELLCGLDEGLITASEMNPNGGLGLSDYFPLCTQSNTGGWVKRVFDLRLLSGKRVSIQFNVISTDFPQNSRMYVDDLALVVDPNAGLTHVVQLPAIVNPPPAPISSVLVNGDFEQGNSGWTEVSMDQQPLITNTDLSVPPRSGQWVARFAGKVNGLEYISQQVDLSATQAQNLEFYYRVESNDACGHILFGVFVNDRRFYAETICIFSPDNYWERVRIDLSSFQGQRVTITFRVVGWNAADPATILFIDDVALTPRP